MNVSLHARGQLLSRMAAPDAVAIIRELEAARPVKLSEARIIRRFSSNVASDNRWGLSNGGVLVAIIERSTVVTVYWRREGQPFTPEHFRVEWVRDFTAPEEQEASRLRVESTRAREHLQNVTRLGKAWEARVRA